MTLAEAAEAKSRCAKSIVAAIDTLEREVGLSVIVDIDNVDVSTMKDIAIGVRKYVRRVSINVQI
jgi:hypothetical protein